MLLSWLRAAKPRSHSRPPRRPFTLRTERLEDRAIPSAAPPASLLKDINTHTGSALNSSPTDTPVEMNGRLYFVADDGVHGRELWSTDGSPAGTAMVADINPGLGAGLAWHNAGLGLAKVGDKLIFAADDGVHGPELWSSDGTAAGTKMVADINPTTDGLPARIGSQIDNLMSAGGVVYFTADDGSHGNELWTSDSTAAGTHMVADINPTPGWVGATAGSNPADLVAIGNQLYFAADDGTHGQELWTADQAGARLVKDITPDDPNTVGNHLSSNPSQLTSLGGKLFFTAGVGKLFVSDGTDAGTHQLATGLAEGIWQLAPVGDTLYFTAFDPVLGQQLWRTDGTDAGTVQVEMPDMAGATITGLYNLTASSNRLFFAAQTIRENQFATEIWTADPSLGASSMLLSRPNPAADGSAVVVGNLRDMDGTLYFDVNQAVWTSDGTLDGTRQLKDYAAGQPAYAAGPIAVAHFNGNTYLAADDGTHGMELWKTDNTAAGTIMLTDLNAVTLSSAPLEAVTVGETVYFSADDGVNGRALWKSDGTPAGTQLVKDIWPGPDSSGGPVDWPGGFGWLPAITHLTRFHDELYFAGDDGTNGQQLWVSDGTAHGTQMVTALGLAPGGANTGHGIDNLTVIGDRLYFTETAFDGSVQLWKTDGSIGGETLVHAFDANGFPYPLAASPAQPATPPYYYPGSIGNMTDVNGTLFFSAYDKAHGQELWSSDGTAAGTKMVADINPGSDSYTYQTGSGADGVASYSVPHSSNPANFTVLNGKLYFSAGDTDHGRELWVSDGTSAGTKMVKDINPGPTGALEFGAYGGSDTDILAAGGKLYFNAEDGIHGQELWVSDGTDAGTHLLKNIRPDDGLNPASALFMGSSIRDLTALGSAVLFSADDGVHGSELWKSDGTEAGTTLVTDIATGQQPIYPGGPLSDQPAGSFPGSLVSIGGRTYFTATDEHGTQIWSSDGTAAGTVRETDGPNSSLNGLYSASSTALTPVGNNLFFAADDGVHGQEPWVLPLPLDSAAGGVPGPVVIGGDTFAVEGGTLHLSASVPGRTDNASLKFSWDLNNDGQFADARGATPTLVGAQLRALELFGGPDGHTIRVKVEDRAGHEIGIGSTSIRIDDAPLSVVGAEFAMTEGQSFNRNVASFRDPGGFEGVSHYHATISWGDGTTSPGAILRDGSQYRVAGEHAYATHGSYSVGVAIDDDGGPPQTANASITVHDAGIFANRTFLRQTAGREFTAAVASFRDRNLLGSAASFTASIAWGDGSTSVGSIAVNGKGGFDVLGTHAYAASGAYTVSVTIDDAGVTTLVTSGVKVDDAHIAARGLTAIATATQDSLVAVAAFRDADRMATASLFTAAIDWADGSGSAGDVIGDGSGGFRVTATHNYGRTGLYSARVTIQDAAGRSASTVGTVRVVSAA